MKLTTPFTILRDAFIGKGAEDIHCFIDDTEVSVKQCGTEEEEKLGGRNAEFWKEECEEHPNNSHCKVFE